MRQSGKIRLAFSGRLIAIKGADHLVEVAAELKQRGTAFEFLICGGGELEKEMRDRVRALSLEEEVRFMGNLDFATELMPLLRERVDLFVCCHRQGDPSCTYLETMGCGVPIVGYANAAFRGVVETSGAGWTVPMDHPGAMAKELRRWGNGRTRLNCTACAAWRLRSGIRLRRRLRRGWSICAGLLVRRGWRASMKWPSEAIPLITAGGDRATICHVLPHFLWRVI
jgi:glycosyltransferase involved in cell wall biosynthesis